MRRLIAFALLCLTPAWAAREIINGAGDTSIIITASSLTILQGSDMSAGLWIKIGAGATAGGVIFSRSCNIALPQPDELWMTYGLLLAGASTAWDITYRHENSSAQTNTWDINLSNDTWYYLGITRDVTGKTVNLYYGTAASALTNPTAYTYTLNPDGAATSTGLRFFKRNVCGGSTNALLDDVTVAHFGLWSRELTANEHVTWSGGRRPSGAILLEMPFTCDSPEPDWSGNNLDTSTIGSNINCASNPPIGPTYAQHPPSLWPLLWERLATAFIGGWRWR